MDPVLDLLKESDIDFNSITNNKQSNIKNDPDNIVKMTSIITDLKMISGIYSNEITATSLCVFDEKNKSKTIGVVHIHNILKNDIL